MFVIRKLLSVLLCLAVFGSFVACGAESPADSEASVLSGSEAETQTDALTDSVSSDSAGALKEMNTVEDVLFEFDHLVGLCDQGNSRVIIRDLAYDDWENDRGIVWEFKHKTCSSVAGIKFRDSEYWGGKVVLLCYHGGAMIVSYETKEILLHTEWTGSNPHSVELLPNGCFIVASSTDNDIRIYAPGEERPAASMEYPNAHGVLWDPENEVLWAVGMNQLGAIAVLGTVEDPSLSLIQDMVYKTPKAGMHDLAPVYSDSNKLFVTCSAGIMVFDKTAESFSYSYPGGTVGRLHDYAPGCGSFREDDVFVFTTIRENTMVLNDWCTNQVFVYVPFTNGSGKLVQRKDSDDAYYKIRVVNFDYQ